MLLLIMLSHFELVLKWISPVHLVRTPVFSRTARALHVLKHVMNVVEGAAAYPWCLVIQTAANGGGDLPLYH